MYFPTRARWIGGVFVVLLTGFLILPFRSSQDDAPPVNGSPGEAVLDDAANEPGMDAAGAKEIEENPKTVADTGVESAIDSADADEIDFLTDDHPHWPGARVLDQRVERVNGSPVFMRVRWIQPRRFPYSVRMEEEVSPAKGDGGERVIRRTEMAADHFLVKVRAGADRSDFLQALRSRNIAVEPHPTAPDLYLARLGQPAMDAVPDALEALRGDKQWLQYMEPDYVVHALATPNDPFYEDGSLWGLNNTGQDRGVADADLDGPEAWDIVSDAGDVVVAVIDTGIRYTHEDLSGNMWVNAGETAGDGVDNDANGVVDDVHGFNAVDENGDPMDDNGHGTHVSGTIGAVGDNGVGVAGVAWNVQLMGCKFLDEDGGGTLSGAIACIDYARENGADIMSNSWGGGDFSQSLEDAIDRARQEGILFVAAAGNEGADNDRIDSFPADYELDNVVSVASMTRLDALSGFSNIGESTVDVAAPGSDILSAWHESDSDYLSISGTSMAAPHVSGAFALLKSRYPSESYRTLIDRLYGGVERVGGIHSLAGFSGLIKTGGRVSVANSLALEEALPLPRFARRLTDQIAAVGSNLTLEVEVEVEGEDDFVYTWSKNGKALEGERSPALEFADLQTEDGGIYRVAVANAAGIVTSTARILVSVPDIELGRAIDAEELDWFTQSQAPWSAQTQVTRDGADAAMSGIIGHNEQSVMQANVAGPGRIRFWWSVSSEFGYDFLVFFIDGVGEDGISGIRDWSFYEFEIPEGPHTVGWAYVKDFSVEEGEDRGYVDEVVYTPNAGIPPRVLSQPESLTIQPGTDVFFEVAAAGTEPLRYQWLKDSAVLDGATAARLELTNAGFAEAGEYQVEVENDDGRVLSAVAHLVVEEEAQPPRITRQPESTTTPTGSSVGLQVTVAGTFPFSYQWSKDGTDLNGETGRELRFANVSVDDVGEYRVRVENAGGFVVSESARLQVTDASLAPRIVKQPFNATVTVGQDVVLTVEASGPEPIAYQWNKDGEDLDGATDAQLTLLQVDVDDIGEYRVRVSNPFGSVNSVTAQVNVELTNEFIGAALDNTELIWSTSGNAVWHFQETVTHDGVDALQSGAIPDQGVSWFDTVAEGPGQISFWWRVSSEPNFDFLEFEMDDVVMDSISGESEWERHTFAVPEGRHRLRWRYAKDEFFAWGEDAGWVDEVEFVPLDTEAPLFTRHPASQSALEGRSLSLQAGAVGSYPLSLQWVKDGSPIPGETSSRLILDPLELSDAGLYQARASNAFGEALSKPATVVVFNLADPFGQALNASEAVWNSGGEADWFPTIDQTFDGLGALQSGAVNDGETSSFSTTLTGPVTLSFWWKASSEPGFDFLRFYMDDRLDSLLSGEFDWVRHFIEIPEGDHTLRWAYEKDIALSAGRDAGWVDLFEIEEGVTAFNGALDEPGQTYFSSGNALWGVDRFQAVRGRGSARSPEMGDQSEAVLSTVVEIEAPEILTFRWRVSSEPGYDFLSFYMDSALQNEWSGLIEWRETYVYLESGTHSLQWVYSKDASDLLGEDAAWIDYVEFDPYVDVGDALREGLDSSDGSLVSYGARQWENQASVSFDGQDALASGLIGDKQESILEARIEGPCVLGFDWKVSSELDFDYLLLQMDGFVLGGISGEEDWSHVEIPVSEGEHVIRWIYSKDESASDGADRGWVDQLTCRSVDAAYNQAADSNGLRWGFYGPDIWFPQSDVTHDGQDALRSPFLFEGELASFYTDLAGPGTLTFWWKASSEAGADYLDFLVDGLLQDDLSGETDWERKVVAIGGGVHRVEWSYSKDFGVNAGMDAGFVDEVRFVRRSNPFLVWRQNHFNDQQLADLKFSGPEADPDVDGLDNYSEYVFGLDPKNPVNQGLPEGRLIEEGARQFFELSFQRLIDDPNIEYAIESSRDLSQWEVVDAQRYTENRRVIGVGLALSQIRFADPVGEPPRLYYRVRVRRLQAF